MSVHDDQVEKILNALWERPGVLWGVLKRLEELPPVVGPWKKVNAARDDLERCGANGICLASVSFMPTMREKLLWRWQILDGTLSRNMIATDDQSSSEEAKDAADKWLRNNDHILIDEGP